MTGGEATINRAVEEKEPIHDVNVVMEIFGVHDEYILTISDVETAWLAAVEVLTPGVIWAQCIWTRRSFRKRVESFLQEINSMLYSTQNNYHVPLHQQYPSSATT